MNDALTTHMQHLANLIAQAATIAAPYNAYIQALEVAKADALASLTWQIDTLKALVKPLVLAEKHSIKPKNAYRKLCPQEDMGR